MEYEECFEIMGKDRNSYSKTDLEATFMSMYRKRTIRISHRISGMKNTDFYERFLF